jgi:hypothetical protein
VPENGLQICRVNQAARADVVLLFALFHDSRSEGERKDPEHGERAAMGAEDYFRHPAIAQTGKSSGTSGTSAQA